MFFGFCKFFSRKILGGGDFFAFFVMAVECFRAFAGGELKLASGDKGRVGFGMRGEGFALARVAS